MWRPLSRPLPDDLALATLAMWEWPGMCQIGVMRTDLLGPPTLWLEMLTPTFRDLRELNRRFDDLHYLAGEPYVLAEVDNPVSRRFIEFAGFHLYQSTPSIDLYFRSV